MPVLGSLREYFDFLRDSVAFRKSPGHIEQQIEGKITEVKNTGDKIFAFQVTANICLWRAGGVIMQGGKVRCNINFVSKSTSYISAYNPF